MRSRALVAALALLLPATSRADLAMPEGPRATLDLMYQTLAEAAPDLPASLDADDLSLLVTLPEGETASLYPDNLDMALRAEPDATRRQEIFDRHMATVIASLRGTDMAAAVDPASVMPVIRNWDLLPGMKPDEMPHLPFAGGLNQYWVADSVETTASLDSEMAEGLGLDTAGLTSLSHSNLSARLETMSVTQDGPFSTIWLDGYYESSLMLLPDLWQQQAEGHDGLIAAIPTRDRLIWIADASAAQATDLRRLARDAFERGPYAISPDLFRWTGEGWVVLAE